MDPVILICISVLTVFICAFIVYAILILVEVRKILTDARIMVEGLAKRIEKINNTIDAVTGFFSFFNGITQLFKKKD